MKQKGIQIGYRTIKTAIASSGALLLAQFLNLSNASLVVVTALISIQSTKKKSLVVAFQRLLACLIALFVGWILLEKFGYQPLTLVLYLLVMLPLLNRLGLQEGIVLSSVILMSFYVHGDFTLGLVFNQISLLIIGIGVALLVNLYMPSIEKDLHKTKEIIEENFKYIFVTMSVHMKRQEQKFPRDIIVETSVAIEEGKELAFMELENSLLSKKDYYYAYFAMREKQFFLIAHRLVPLLETLSYTYLQTEMLADFIEEIGLSICESNTGETLLKGLKELIEQMEEMELPKTRQEFETRASLVNMSRELGSILRIKGAFAEEWAKL